MVKLRILVVSQYFWPEQFLINELVADLVKEGHDVVVLTGEPNYPNGELYPEYLSNKNKFQYFFGAEIKRAALIPRGQGGLKRVLNYLSFMFSSSFKVRKILQKETFDIVFFFQLSPIFSGLAAALYKIVKGAPMVTWVQDVWPETLSATGQVKNKHVLNIVGRFVNFIYRKSDLILIQSEKFRDLVVARCNDSSKVHYFPNWADAVFSEKNFLVDDFYEKADGVFDVVFAGNIGEAQDFDTIIDAVNMIKQLQKYRIVVVGDGKVKQRAINKIKQLNLDDKFLFLGQRPIEYMPSVFSKADAMLVTLSDEEIFSYTIPSKLQAYLAAGRPILASLSGAGADVVMASGAGILSTPGSPLMLSKAITQLLELPQLELQTMSANGRKYYDEHFDKDMLRGNLIKLFDSVKN